MTVRSIAFAALLALGATPLSAQDWKGNFTLYGWLPAIEGAQEAPNGEPIVDLDSEDILDALDLAFMATGQIHKDRWGAMFDVVYTDLGSDAKAKAPFTAKASVGTTIWFATLAGTYRLTGDDENFVGVYGGIRYFDASADMKVSLLDDRIRKNVNADANWVDPIIGVQGRYPLSERWSLYGFGDVGGFDVGSNFTWQAYSGVNYEFSERFAGNLGVRFMSIDYEDKVKLDVDVYGPLLGITYRF
jgi:hypothetical protein